MGLIDGVSSFVGKAVDYGAHAVGGTLEAVGLDDLGHAVEKWGDGIADDLGAAVGERNLGESEDPKELVHGDVKKLGETVAHLRNFAAAFETTGEGLGRMDSEHWQGKAADAFRRRFGDHPTQWLVTGKACADAATALNGLSTTVEWAQGQAQRAIDLFRESQKASKDAWTQYKGQVDAYNRDVRAYNDAVGHGQSPAAPARPGEYSDPGASGRAEAAQLLIAARRGRDEAARAAEAAIRAATSAAPKRAGFLDSLANDIVDAPQIMAVSAEHLTVGFIKGGADLLKFARGVNPMDPYNLTHPAQYADHVSQVGIGLAHTTMHPMQLVEALVGSGWGSDPSEAGGKLLFNVLSGVATGGAEGGALLAERVGIDAVEGAAKNEAVHAAENGAANAARRAAGGAGEWTPKPVPYEIPTAPIPWEVRKPFYPEEPAAAVPHEPTAVAPREPAGGGDPFGTQVRHEPAPPQEPAPQAAHEAPPAAHEPPAASEPAPETAHEPAPDNPHEPGHDSGRSDHDGGGSNDDGAGQSAGPEDTAPAKPREPALHMKSFEEIMEENRIAQEMADAHRSVSDGALTFRDGNQISDTQIRDFGRQWHDDVRNMTPDQDLAVKGYTYGETDDILGALRGSRPMTPEIEARIGHLDEAVAARPVPEDVMVARGTDLGHLHLKDPKDLEGLTITEDGFMSTSPGDRPPAAFAGKEAILHLRVPAGTKGLWVENIGTFGGAEQELLLGRGLKWRADKVIVDTKGKVHVYGEVVP
ncbi:putative T7SS-secreted protein [Kitasatospora griseola]|uniref:putative T7SS-secreted protein n=1 Tax=Kitasatospora griseola TaxID=2064 RepID=UPI003435733C